jgi:hypothetical protein
MTDPVTVGALVVGALSMTAEAVLKGAVGEAAKDGYKALKEKVSRWASGDVEELEKTPGSAARQAVIAEIIDAQPKEDQLLLRDLAEALVAKLKESAPTIGLDIGRLTDVETRLRKITVTQGVGARIQEVRGGRLEVDGLKVGPSAKK